MHFTTTVAAIGLAALLPTQVAGFFRMPCPGRLVTERADPIISPGSVSGHIHQIAGGNGFGFTESYEDARKSTCSSCPLKADLSNYWTPVLYYKSQNGSFTKVPQAGDGTGVEGGMTVYYQQRGTDTNVKAFPEGLRMLAGNPFKRNFTGDFAAEAVSFVCLDYNGKSSQSNSLPTQACPDGVRAQVYFPSCWDGVNLDSPDHASHVVYPATGADDGGTCPSTHNVQLVSIFYEVIFSTDKFDWWSGDYGTNQPFVFSMGDPTGYGFHGDFINGWDVPVLQEAIDTCLDQEFGGLNLCPVLYNNMFTSSESNACQLPSSIDEEIMGPLDQLPGCNPVTAGPEMASPVTTCAVPPIVKPKAMYTDLTSQGWAYIGCVNDTGSTRALDGYTNMYDADQSTTTVESCTTKCKSGGFTYAGLEDGKQCFCGNSIADSDMPQFSGVIGACQAPCTGDSSEICGGANSLSTYKTCSGSSCTNAQFVAINPSIEGLADYSSSNSSSSATYSAPAYSATSSAPAASKSSTSSKAGAYGSASSLSSSTNTIASTALANYGAASSSSSTSIKTRASTSSLSAYGNKAHKASSTLAAIIKSSATTVDAAAASTGVSGAGTGSDDGTCDAAAVTQTVRKTVYVTETAGAAATSQAGKRSKHHHGKHLRAHKKHAREA